jgi:hypothetical protein
MLAKFGRVKRLSRSTVLFVQLWWRREGEVGQKVGQELGQKVGQKKGLSICLDIYYKTAV